MSTIEGQIQREEIVINLKEKETSRGMQLGKIENITAFNDMLKYTKMYKKKSGLYIVFNEGHLQISNRDVVMFSANKCYYNGIELSYDANVTKVNERHMLEIWLENDIMIRSFFVLYKNKMYLPADLSTHNILEGRLVFTIRFIV